jgi:hypothetical protein
MQTLGRLPMQSFVRCNLCQDGLSVHLYAWSFLGLLFMEEDDVQPPSTTTITASLGLGMASVNSVLGRRGGFSLDAASLDCCEGTPMEDVDEGETRGVEVEALGGEETEAVTPDDEAMYREKVTMRPQCDRLGTEDTTQVEVAWSMEVQVLEGKRV